MKRRRSLAGVLRLRLHTEALARASLARASQELVASEEALAAAERAERAAMEELASQVGGGPLDLGAVERARQDVETSARRRDDALRAKARAVATVDVAARSLHAARRERRLLEDLLARRRSAERAAAFRRESRALDELAASRRREEDRP
ncbi:MAG: hypothetical protein D6731_20360 [Planctomycetota bacterium]|nr:MAG: hypothetical protein D6731_20360 [Planctomycetota bacterium]